MRAINGRFSDIFDELSIHLSRAPEIDVGEWQAIQTDIPQTRTIEVQDISFEMPLTDSKLELQREVGPNLPWAEDHFQERVSGVPHNPPPSHEWWPYAQQSNAEHREGGQFSHTYPERFWPAFAGGSQEAHQGIRYPYGDLADLVRLLRTRPGTRQAYLPVWFPEDLAAADSGERVPCTLGYHFLVRDSKLKIVYYIRSCDFFRHFRDDVYMAGRLAQWVADQISVTPSKMVMHISSLHIFAVEREAILSRAESVISRNMGKI